MSIYGKAFFNNLYESIIPLCDYVVDISKLKYWTFKSYLKRLSVTTKILKKENSYLVEIPIGDFYKVLVSEIELFINKANMQHYEAEKIKHFSNNWNFVTLYYSFFFSASALLRFLHSGFVYLDEEIKAIFERNISVYDSASAEVPIGNFYFSEVEKNDTNVIVSFTHGGRSPVHEKMWVQLEAILKKSFYKNNAETDEIDVLNKIFEVCKKYRNKFPSETRNKFNYPAESALSDIYRVLNDYFSYDYSLESFLTSDFIVSPYSEDGVKATIFYYKLVFSYVRKYYESFQSRLKDKTFLYKHLIDYEKRNKIKIEDFIFEK